MVERRVQLVDGVRPEGIAHIRTVEGDPHSTERTSAVIGDVGEFEPFNRVPGSWIEDLRYHDPIL
jgi:hypothetical protein